MNQLLHSSLTGTKENKTQQKETSTPTQQAEVWKSKWLDPRKVKQNLTQLGGGKQYENAAWSR